MSEGTLRCKWFGHKYNLIGPPESWTHGDRENANCVRCGKDFPNSTSGRE